MTHASNLIRRLRRTAYNIRHGEGTVTDSEGSHTPEGKASHPADHLPPELHALMDLQELLWSGIIPKRIAQWIEAQKHLDPEVVKAAQIYMLAHARVQHYSLDTKLTDAFWHLCHLIGDRVNKRKPLRDQIGPPQKLRGVA